MSAFNCPVCGDGRLCRCQTQNGGSSLALTPLFDQELQQKDKVSLIPDADSSTQGDVLSFLLLNASLKPSSSSFLMATI